MRPPIAAADLRAHLAETTAGLPDAIAGLRHLLSQHQLPPEVAPSLLAAGRALDRVNLHLGAACQLADGLAEVES